MYDGRMRVRPYEERDREHVHEVHMGTASEHARTDQAHGEFSLLMYCDEYLDHETAFVLCDENDVPRGYVLAAEDALVWVKNMAPYAEKIRQLGEPYLTRVNDGLREYPMAYAEYPAHLHIDIMEEYTGHHHGTMLMEAMLTRLRKDQVKGVCLGVSRDNQRAFAFYQKMGFEVLVSDESGYFMGQKLI